MYLAFNSFHNEEYYADSIEVENYELIQQRLEKVPIENNPIDDGLKEFELAGLRAENRGLDKDRDVLRSQGTPPRECVVCLQVFTIMKPAIALSCFPKTHHYHKDCLKDMLKRGNDKCAYCSKKFTAQSIVPPQSADTEFQQYMELGIKRCLNRSIEAEMIRLNTHEIEVEHTKLLLRRAWKDAEGAFKLFTDARKKLISFLEKRVWYLRGQVAVNIASIAVEVASVPIFFSLGPIPAVAITTGSWISRKVLNGALFKKICGTDAKIEEQYDACEQLSQDPYIKAFIQLYDRIFQRAFELAKKNDSSLLKIAGFDTFVTITAALFGLWSHVATAALMGGSLVTLGFQCYFTYKDTKQKLNYIDILKDYIKTMKDQDRCFEERVSELESSLLDPKEIY